LGNERKNGMHELKYLAGYSLAHFKEKDHNKVFYNLCEYMEPDYHQLEFDLRIYLTHLALAGPLYGINATESPHG
jgi:predicted metal-dependent hydrolase